MANIVSGNPIRLDTAVANFAALGLPNNLALDVRCILWLNPTSVGDTYAIKNADGLILANGVCEAASGSPGNAQVKYYQPRELVLTKNQGWFLQQISSGTLVITFEYA